MGYFLAVGMAVGGGILWLPPLNPVPVNTSLGRSFHLRAKQLPDLTHDFQK
jgi:hypothetical protein